MRKNTFERRKKFKYAKNDALLQIAHHHNANTRKESRKTCLTASDPITRREVDDKIFFYKENINSEFQLMAY